MLVQSRIGGAVDTRVETPQQMAHRVMAAYLPELASTMATRAARGASPRAETVETWLLVYGADVRSALDGDPRVNVLPPEELDAIVGASAFGCAHLRDGLDDAVFAAEFAVHVAVERVREVTPPAPPAALAAPAPERCAPAPEKRPLVEDVKAACKAMFTWSPTPRKLRKPRTRRVRFCEDVTDSRGRVVVPEDTYGVALDWPWFTAPLVRVENTRGQSMTVRVPPRALAVVDS